MKLLIVEDETPTASYLRRGLIEEGFAVDIAPTAAEADSIVAVNDYDAIVLDIMLRGGDGFSLCRQWRDGGLTTPILYLTARDQVADRVHGLEMGGDDYLVKPFAFEELLARVRALIRRAHGMAAASLLRIGDIVIDTGRRQVRRQEKIVPLTAREYQILEYFAFRAGQLVTRTALWEHVWESGREPDSNVVDVYVRYLRNKLGRDPDVIETVRGMGYILQEGVNGPKA